MRNHTIKRKWSIAVGSNVNECHKHAVERKKTALVLFKYNSKIGWMNWCCSSMKMASLDGEQWLEGVYCSYSVFDPAVGYMGVFIL